MLSTDDTATDSGIIADTVADDGSPCRRLVGAGDGGGSAAASAAAHSATPNAFRSIVEIVEMVEMVAVLGDRVPLPNGVLPFVVAVDVDGADGVVAAGGGGGCVRCGEKFHKLRAPDDDDDVDA